MSDRFFAWQDTIARRDVALMQLAALAVAAVFLWVWIRLLPLKWQQPAKGLFLTGVVFAFYGTLFLVVGGR
jgi:hypothetical protein